MKVVVVVQGVVVMGELVEKDGLPEELKAAMSWTEGQRGGLLKNVTFPAYPDQEPLMYFWVMGELVGGHGVQL